MIVKAKDTETRCPSSLYGIALATPPIGHA